MTNAIIIVVVFVILRTAIRYIVKQKKQGAVCIGCPSASACSKRGTECSCHTDFAE